PMDLVKLLILYISPDNLKKLVDIPFFKSLYDNEEFWHKLVLEHFSSNPNVNVRAKSWEGWRNYYIKCNKNLNSYSKKSTGAKIEFLIFSSWEKKLRTYIETIDDPFLLYFVLVKANNLDLTFIKYLIETKKLDWPKMYSEWIDQTKSYELLKKY